MTSPGFSRSIRQFIGKNILRHRSLARCRVAMGRCAVLMMPEPRHSHRRGGRLHDAADHDAIGEHVEVVTVPLARSWRASWRGRGRCARRRVGTRSPRTTHPGPRGPSRTR